MPEQVRLSKTRYRTQEGCEEYLVLLGQGALSVFREDDWEGFEQYTLLEPLGDWVEASHGYMANVFPSWVAHRKSSVVALREYSLEFHRSSEYGAYRLVLRFCAVREVLLNGATVFSVADVSADKRIPRVS